MFLTSRDGVAIDSSRYIADCSDFHFSISNLRADLLILKKRNIATIGLLETPKITLSRRRKATTIDPFIAIDKEANLLLDSQPVPKCYTP